MKRIYEDWKDLWRWLAINPKPIKRKIESLISADIRHNRPQDIKIIYRNWKDLWNWLDISPKVLRKRIEQDIQNAQTLVDVRAIYENWQDLWNWLDISPKVLRKKIGSELRNAQTLADMKRIYKDWKDLWRWLAINPKPIKRKIKSLINYAMKHNRPQDIKIIYRNWKDLWNWLKISPKTVKRKIKTQIKDTIRRTSDPQRVKDIFVEWKDLLGWLDLSPKSIKKMLVSEIRNALKENRTDDAQRIYDYYKYIWEGSKDIRTQIDISDYLKLRIKHKISITKALGEGRFAKVEREQDDRFVVTYGDGASWNTFSSMPLVEAMKITFDMYNNNSKILKMLRSTAYIFITPEDTDLSRAPPFLWYDDVNRNFITHARHSVKHAVQASYLPYGLIYHLINTLHQTTDAGEVKRIKILIARIIRHEAQHAWNKKYGDPNWEDWEEVNWIIEKLDKYLVTSSTPFQQPSRSPKALARSVKDKIGSLFRGRKGLFLVALGSLIFLSGCLEEFTFNGRRLDTPFVVYGAIFVGLTGFILIYYTTKMILEFLESVAEMLVKPIGTGLRLAVSGSFVFAARYIIFDTYGDIEVKVALLFMLFVIGSLFLPVYWIMLCDEFDVDIVKYIKSVILFIKNKMFSAIGKGMKPEDHEPVINRTIRKGMIEGRFVKVERKNRDFEVTYGKRDSEKTFNSAPLVEAMEIAFDQYADDPEIIKMLETTAHLFITPEDGDPARAPPFILYEDANRYLLGHAGRGLDHEEQNSYLPYALISRLIDLLHQATNSQDTSRLKYLIARIIRHEAQHAWNKRYGDPEWEDEAEVREIIIEVEQYLAVGPANLLTKYGFDREEFNDLHRRYRYQKSLEPKEISQALSIHTNIVSGRVEAYSPKEVVHVPDEETIEYDNLEECGEKIIRDNKLAVIALNGGIATRFRGTMEDTDVKGLFPVLGLIENPSIERTFVEIKLGHTQWASQRYRGRIIQLLLNSYFTEEDTMNYLRKHKYFGFVPGEDLLFYNAGIRKRLIPTASDIRREYASDITAGKIRQEQVDMWVEQAIREGEAGVYESEDEIEGYNPPGHFDAVRSLVLSGRLRELIDKGVKYIWISNIDNLGATIEPAILGVLEKSGKDVLVELAEKYVGDAGGATANVNGRTQLVEQFAFPGGFDQNQLPHFNTATYVIKTDALLKMFNLTADELRTLSQDGLERKVKEVVKKIPIYVVMKKAKETRKDGTKVERPVVQFERLLGDITTPGAGLDCLYAVVDREKRFFPIKAKEDLEKGRNVTFQFNQFISPLALDPGQRVYVGGTFNNWIPEAFGDTYRMRLYPDGIWRVTVPLGESGEFKYAVDGEYQNAIRRDPLNPYEVVRDVFGTLNYRIKVPTVKERLQRILQGKVWIHSLRRPRNRGFTLISLIAVVGLGIGVLAGFLYMLKSGDFSSLSSNTALLRAGLPWWFSLFCGFSFSSSFSGRAKSEDSLIVGEMINSEKLTRILKVAAEELKGKFPGLSEIIVDVIGSFGVLASQKRFIPLDKFEDFDLFIDLSGKVDYQALVKQLREIINRECGQEGAKLVISDLTVKKEKETILADKSFIGKVNISFESGRQVSKNLQIRVRAYDSSLSLEEINKARHKRFADFLIQRFEEAGTIFWDWIEVKPDKKVLIPVNPKDNPRKYIIRYLVYEYVFGGDAGRESSKGIVDKYISSTSEEYLNIAQQIEQSDRTKILETVLTGSASGWQQGVTSGFTWNLFKKLSEGVEYLAKLGLSTEIGMEGKRDGVDNISKEEIAKIREISRRYGTVLTAHAPFTELSVCTLDNKLRKRSLKKVKKAIKIASKMGIKLITVHQGPMHKIDADNREKAWQKTIEVFKDLVSYGKECGVEIAVESLYPALSYKMKLTDTPDVTYELLSTPKDMAKLLSAVPGLKMTFDTAHANWTMGCIEYFEQLAELIDVPTQLAEIHLSDNFRSQVGREHMGFGEGDIDIVKFFTLLAKYGFKGYLVAENYSNYGSDQCSPGQLLEGIQKLNNYLKVLETTSPDPARTKDGLPLTPEEGKPIVVTIDGVASVGKSSTAKEVARRIGGVYISLGGIYRLITWLAIQNGLDPGKKEDVNRLIRLAHDIEYEENPDGEWCLFYEGEKVGAEVTRQLSEKEVDDKVASISKKVHHIVVPVVQKVVKTLRENGKNVVVEGRIAGTVIVPDADVKVFLIAGVQERAKRKAAELIKIGQLKRRSVKSVKKDIEIRDMEDEEHIPLPEETVEDIVTIDSTNLTLGEVVDRVMTLIADSYARRSSGLSPPVMKVVSDLRNFPPELPISTQLKKKILETFPILTQLSQAKVDHTFRVLEYLHRLTSGNFRYFYDNLSKAERKSMSTTDRQKYFEYFRGLYEIYEKLTEAEKQTLWLVVILHDIGYTKATAIDHGQKGAELASPILKKVGLARDLVELGTKLIYCHALIGQQCIGEMVPRYVLRIFKEIPQADREKFVNLVRVINSMDLAGWKTDKNVLIPYWQARYLEFGNLENLATIDATGGFYEYRLEKLARTSFDIPDGVDRKKLKTRVAKLIPKEERTIFKKHLNTTIGNITGLGEIILSLNSQDPSYTSLVKLLRFFTQITELSLRDSGMTDISEITSNFYEIPDRQQPLILEELAKRLKDIPERMDLGELKIHLSDNNWARFYGIPLILKEGKLSLDFKFLLYSVELYYKRLKYAKRTGFTKHINWQIEEAALDYTGQPALIESTSRTAEERSKRAQQILRWIHGNEERREDFLKFISEYPVGHTYRNRLTPVYLAIYNYLAGRPFDDRRVLTELPDNLVKDNETLKAHPWFGVDKIAKQKLPHARRIQLDKPKKRKIRILSIGCSEKVIGESSLFYLKQILAHLPNKEKYEIEIAGNDINYQSIIYPFFHVDGDETGIFDSGPSLTKFQFDKKGVYIDPDTGIKYIKLDRKKPEQNLVGKKFKADGKYDIVICSRVAIQYGDKHKKVEQLRKNCRKYLAKGGLLLFDSQYADHIEVIKERKTIPEETVIPYLDLWSFDKRIEKIIERVSGIQPEEKLLIARAHRLGEKYATLRRPMYDKGIIAQFLAEFGEDPISIAAFLVSDVPPEAIRAIFSPQVAGQIISRLEKMETVIPAEPADREEVAKQLWTFRRLSAKNRITILPVGRLTERRVIFDNGLYRVELAKQEGRNVVLLIKREEWEIVTKVFSTTEVGEGADSERATGAVVKRVSREERIIPIADVEIKGFGVRIVKEYVKAKFGFWKRVRFGRVISRLRSLYPEEEILRLIEGSKVRLVQGNDRLAHFARKSREIFLDMDLFGDDERNIPYSQELLSMELEHELTHLVLQTQPVRVPPFVEEVIVTLFEVNRFLSFSRSRQDRVLRTLKADNDLDDALFYRVLEKAQREGLRGVLKDTMEYVRKTSIKDGAGVTYGDITWHISRLANEATIDRVRGEARKILKNLEKMPEGSILEKYGFDPEEFARQRYVYGLQTSLRAEEKSKALGLRNNVAKGKVENYSDDDIARMPDEGSAEYHELSREGEKIIRNGELATVVLNGGISTRFRKVSKTEVKGLCEVLNLPESPAVTRTFLEIKLGHTQWARRRFGGRIIQLILNSYLTEEETIRYLKEHEHFGFTPGEDLLMYNQGISRRLVPTPQDIRRHYAKDAAKGRIGSDQVEGWVEQAIRDGVGEIYHPEEEMESYNPSGHFDAVKSLILTGTLKKLIEKGVKYIWVSNIDNLAALIDPAEIALLKRSGRDVLVELGRRYLGEAPGGHPVKVDGRMQLLENLAFPDDFDLSQPKHINTATYIIKIETILKMFGLSERDLQVLSQEELARRVKEVVQRIPIYVMMRETQEKTTEGRTITRPVAQFERFLGDITSPSCNLDTLYLQVDRERRFFPIKDIETLIEGRPVIFEFKSPLAKNPDQRVYVSGTFNNYQPDARVFGDTFRLKMMPDGVWCKIIPMVGEYEFKYEVDGVPQEAKHGDIHNPYEVIDRGPRGRYFHIHIPSVKERLHEVLRGKVLTRRNLLKSTYSSGTQRTSKDFRFDTEKLRLSEEEHTHPAIQKAIGEGRFFPINKLLGTDLETFFLGSPGQIAQRFARAIEGIDMKILVQSMTENLKDRALVNRLRQGFELLQDIVESSGNPILAGRRYALILEEGNNPTIFYDTDEDGTPVGVLSHSGRNTIYLGLNSTDFAGTSPVNRPSLTALINHENLDLQTGEHIPPTGKQEGLIHKFKDELLKFVAFYQSILRIQPVNPSDMKEQLILREAVRFLNQIGLSPLGNTHIIYRPLPNQELASEHYYDEIGIYRGLSQYRDAEKYIRLHALISDPKVTLNDLRGILDGLEDVITSQGFDSEEDYHSVILDGGLKTRLFGMTLQRVFQGLFRIYNEIFASIVYITLQSVLSQYSKCGKGWTLVLASDNIFMPGKIRVGERLLSELPEDADVVLFGAGSEIPLPKGKDKLNKLLTVIEEESKKIAQRVEVGERKERIDSDLAVALQDEGFDETVNKVRAEDLTGLGLISADAKTGRLIGFKEKGYTTKVIELAIEGGGRVNRNTFCIGFRNRALKIIFEALDVPRKSDGETPLRDYPVSLFATLAEAQSLTREDVERANQFSGLAKECEQKAKQYEEKSEGFNKFMDQAKKYSRLVSLYLPITWDRLAPEDRLQLWEIVQDLRQRLNIYVADVGGTWFDVGSPAQFMEAADYIAFNEDGRRYFALPSIEKRIDKCYFDPSKVRFEDPESVFLHSVSMRIGNKSGVFIGKGVKLSNTYIQVPDNSLLYVGWKFKDNYYIEESEIQSVPNRVCRIPKEPEALAEKICHSILYGWIPQQKFEDLFEIEPKNVGVALLDSEGDVHTYYWSTDVVKPDLVSPIIAGSNFYEWRQQRLNIRYLLDNIIRLFGRINDAKRFIPEVTQDEILRYHPGTKLGYVNRDFEDLPEMERRIITMIMQRRTDLNPDDIRNAHNPSLLQGFKNFFLRITPATHKGAPSVSRRRLFGEIMNAYSLLVEYIIDLRKGQPRHLYYCVKNPTDVDFEKFPEADATEVIAVFEDVAGMGESIDRAIKDSKGNIGSRWAAPFMLTRKGKEMYFDFCEVTGVDTNHRLEKQGIQTLSERFKAIPIISLDEFIKTVTEMVRKERPDISKEHTQGVLRAHTHADEPRPVPSREKQPRFKNQSIFINDLLEEFEKNPVRTVFTHTPYEKPKGITDITEIIVVGREKPGVVGSEMTKIGSFGGNTRAEDIWFYYPQGKEAGKPVVMVFEVEKGKRGGGRFEDLDWVVEQYKKERNIRIFTAGRDDKGRPILILRFPEKEPEKARGDRPSDGKKPGPSRKSREPYKDIYPHFSVGLGISLLMNSDLFAGVGEIMRSGQQAGWGSIFESIFRLGPWAILICAATGIAWALYKKLAQRPFSKKDIERRTIAFAMLKPEVKARNRQDIIEDLKQAGLGVAWVGEPRMLTRKQAELFYAENKTKVKKENFEAMVEYISEGEVVPIVLFGERNSWKKLKALVGHYTGKEPGTLRNKYGVEIIGAVIHNRIHASGSFEGMLREMLIVLNERELEKIFSRNAKGLIDKLTKEGASSAEQIKPSASQKPKGPSKGVWSILFGGLGISLVMNLPLFAGVGEIMRSGQQAGWGSIFESIFRLGPWAILICAATGIAAWALYRQVGVGRSNLMGAERVRLFEVLRLRSIWQGLMSLFERGRSVVAPSLNRTSKSEQLRMSWANLLIEPLSEKEIRRIRTLAEKLRRGEIRRFWTKEGPFFANPEVNPWLGWTPLGEEMGGKVGEIEEFAQGVRAGYENVVVIGKGVAYAKVAEAIGERRGYPQVLVLEATHPEAVRKIESKVNLGKTLFVVSSPVMGEGYEAYKYLYGKLTEFYKAHGVSAEEILSEVGKHFVGIGEANRQFVKEARERKFLRVFTEEMGVSRSIFSYEGLVPLALAGVNIEKFVESGKRGREICGEENMENNPGMQLALFQEKMRESGREIFIVLPEGLEGFGEAMQELAESLWGGEGKIIPIAEGELSHPESYGEKAAFITIRMAGTLKSARPVVGGSPFRVTVKSARPVVGGSPFRVTAELKEAGYPVFELPLRGKEAIGELFYAGEFATALSYLMRIDKLRSPVAVEELLPSEAVGGGEVVSLAGAIGFEMEKGEPLSEYPVRPEVLRYKGTKVLVFDFESLFDMEPVKEATPSRMSIELKVKPKSRGVFKVMEKVVKAAEEAGNLDGVKFAFVSSRRDVTGEVMEEMLRDYMSGYGLRAELIDSDLIIDRKKLGKNGGIVGIAESAKISTKAVFNIINEKLLLSGRSDGNGTEINIITDRESRWAKDGTRKMMERILWVLLEPAKEGEVVSTAAGLVVAIEGKVSRWLVDFIRARYSEDEAKRLLSQIVRDGKVILPAMRVDEKYLQGIKSEARIYKLQA